MTARTDQRIQPIANPDPDIDQCDHCHSMGESSLATVHAPDPCWLNDQGEACRDRGEATTLCQECYDTVSGCRCGLLHGEDIYDLSDAAQRNHNQLMDRNDA